MTRISVILVLQHTDDHDLISSTDQICFTRLKRSHTNKMSQQDDEQNRVDKKTTAQKKNKIKSKSSCNNHFIKQENEIKKFKLVISYQEK